MRSNGRAAMKKLAFAALALAATVALANDTMVVRFARALHGRNVTVCLDGTHVKTAFAGKLGFQSETSSWATVCAAVRKPITNGQFANIKPRYTDEIGGNMAKAGNIVAKYFNEAKSDDECAALQIAVWEAIEDGGSKANFQGGKFQVLADPGVLALAQGMYGAADQGGSAALLQAGNGTQDQITVRL